MLLGLAIDCVQGRKLVYRRSKMYYSDNMVEYVIPVYCSDNMAEDVIPDIRIMRWTTWPLHIFSLHHL